MGSDEDATETDSPSEDSPTSPDTAKGTWLAPRFKGQGVLSGALIALGLLVLLIGTVAVWFQLTVLETDEFVDTVGPLIEDEEVTDALARTLTDQIFAQVDTADILSEDLPNLPSFLPPLLDSALERVTLRLTEDLLQTDVVRDVWFTAVRAAHTAAVAIIEGDTRIQDNDGQVVLDLSGVVDRVGDRLNDLGINLGLRDEIESSDLGKVVLIEDGQLGTVQDAVELLDTLSWLLPIATVVLLAAGIYVSRSRRSSGLRAAVGVFVMMVVLGLALRLSRRFLLDNVKEENRQAVENIWDHVTRRLSGMMIGLAVIALVVMIAIWLTGRSASSVAARNRARGWLDTLRGGRLGELTPEGLDEKIAPRRRAIEVGAILLTVVILWAQPTLSGTAVVVAAVLLGIFLLLVEFLVRPPHPSEEEPADADAGDGDDSELAEHV